MVKIERYSTTITVDDFSDNWDLTVAGSSSGMPVLTDTTMPNSDRMLCPRFLAALNTDGSDLAGGHALFPVDESLSITIANAGNATSGTLTFFIHGEWIDQT